MEHHDPRLVHRRDPRLLAQLFAELFLRLLGLIVANRFPQQDELRLFPRRHSRLQRRRNRLLDDGWLQSLEAFRADRGGLGGARCPRRPVDPIEIEAGGAVGLDVAKLEAIDRGEVQQAQLAHERLEQPLGDEDDPRRPSELHVRGHEPLHRLGVFQTPRVCLEGSDEHGIVRGETENDQHRAIPGIERGDLDGRAAEIEVRRDDLEAGLHRVDVVRDERSEVLQV